MKSRLPKRMRDYLREQSACCKASTVKGYRGILRCFYNDLGKTSAIDSLTKRQLQEYLLHLCERNLAPYSKVNYMLAVKKYLQWEVERGRLSESLLSVMDRSKLPPVPEYLPRPLSSENDLLLQNKLRASDHPQAPFFLLLRHTGMRISELINLPPDCVLSGLKGEKFLKVPLGKMNNERLVPLSIESLSLIETIRGTASKDNPERLIGMSGEIPQVYNRLSTRFKNISGPMIDQGKPVTFHRLRHSFATSLLTAGVSLVSLMKLLGHRRIEMTLRYAKVTPSHLRDEYLRAVSVLVAQSSLIKPKTSGEDSGSMHPSEIISQLSAFLVNASSLAAPQRHNLLRRLHRLQKDFAQVRFSKRFILDLQRDGSMVRLAS